MRSITSHFARNVIPLISLLFAACCTSVSAVEAWPIEKPMTATVTLDSDVLIHDLAWAEHDEEAMDLLSAEIISQIIDQSGYVLIEIPQLKQRWDARDMRNRRALYDLHDNRINRRRLSNYVRKYGSEFERVISELTERIRIARPGIHFSFVGIDPVSSDRRRARDTDMCDSVPGFHIRESISWDGRSQSLNAALWHDMERASFKCLADQGVPFSFKDHNDQWFLSTFGDLDAQIIDAVFPQVTSPVIAGPSDEPETDGRPIPARPSRADDDSPPTSTPPLTPGEPDPIGEPEPIATDSYIEFPTRSEMPYGSVHGRVRAGDVELHPAKYQRRSTPFVGISLSHIGPVTPSNPRGWLGQYSDLPDVGFNSVKLNQDMEALFELGIREVWFWEWAGQHPRGGNNSGIMAWFSLDGHTPIMRETWPQFVSRWQGRGVRFGFWLGGIVYPNVGTTENPIHEAIQRDHFDFIADTLAQIRAEGFDSVGLDAYTWLLSRRDMPAWANWRDTADGPRDSGIGLALLRRLNTDPRLIGMHIVTEARVPYGEHLAEAGTFKLATSRTDHRSANRPNIDTLEAPEFENIVNPGHEITMYLMGEGRNGNWTMQEFVQMYTKIKNLGYRPALNINVLRELEVINSRGDVLNNISQVFRP